MTKTEVIVASCARYSDAWCPFISLFKKFWPECPWSVTLVADRAPEKWDGDWAIITGRDYGWANNLGYALATLESDVVILFQEDFFLSARAEDEFIKSAVVKVRHTADIGCYRLYPCPGPDVNIDADHGEVKKGTMYRTSCQVAVWKVSYLKKLLHHCTDAASFEIQGTKNSESLDERVLAVRRDRLTWPIQYICSAISRGKWNPDALKLCDRYEIIIDKTRRAVDR